ncbi:MAG: YIP1 family protein [Clostridia bacterium]|nr:YIP1 family protein [Clostridia bacterium]
MKNRLAKILILSLVALLLFGSFTSSAYESYDTYTYSIDGKPLASPHAFTPEPDTYDSKSMGLLDGNYWHYDSTGDAVIWPQKEVSAGFEFVSPLTYSMKEDGTGLLVSSYKVDESVIDTIVSIREAFSAVYGDPNSNSTVKITIPVEDVVYSGNSYVELDNLLKHVNSLIFERVKAAGEGKKVTLAAIDYASVYQSVYDQLGFMSARVAIPEEVDGIPVVGIADGAFAVPAVDESWSDVKKEVCEKLYKDVLAQIVGIQIPESVKTIGASAFGGTTGLTTVYYLGENVADWNKVSFDRKTNAYFARASVYCYSESERFGNLALDKAGTADIVSDEDGNLYIADKPNNRIVILKANDLKVMGVISNYIDGNNKDRVLNSPSGVYVTNSKLMVDGSSRQIYVCDTGNKSIVVFDENYNYIRTIEQAPIAGMLDEGEFEPSAVAVDKYGRIFVVSRTCYKGIMVLSSDGTFTGFIGAQKVTTDFMDQIWKSFQTLEQKQNSILQLPEPFNNLTVDENGFVYATISFTKASDQTQQQLALKSKQPAYSPVKKLNSMGVEIMKRNGFFDPGGEVIDTLSAQKQEVSKIIDVAIGDEGSWTILDSSRQRTYTYDKNGNLLFAFGNTGDQLGNNASCIGIAYQPVYNEDETNYEDYKYNLVMLDSSEVGCYVTVYKPTEYCDMIMNALHNENDHKFSDTINYWQDVLTRNNNFDLAYIGIGKALYHLGEYDEAMEMLSSAYETEYYALAFAEVRKEFISKFMVPLIVAVLALIVLFFKFLGYAKKRNKATSLKVGKKTYGEEMLYVFHLVFHPFDGFWDLKHEKRGSVRAASTILGITIVAFFYQAIGTGYMHNPKGDYSTVFVQIIAVVVPVVLWIVGNWCLTTLFDGEGSFKDIYIATCYSLAPLPLFVVLSTVLSNVLTVTEGSILTLLVSLGYVWVGLLLFFGMVVTHDYSTGKNVITTLGTIVAMAVIMFIILLFSSLVMKMATFLITLFTEIFNRIFT